MQTVIRPDRSVPGWETEWLKVFHARRGFIVVACRYPKECGEILSLEDDYLSPDLRFRVIGGSSADEMRSQIPEGGDSACLSRRFFYRAEAMD